MHAFFGIAIMMQSGLMVAEWFGSMGRTWGPTPLEDQYIGGGRRVVDRRDPDADPRDHGRHPVEPQRRPRSDAARDRHADRTGDAELEAYNARLAAMAERDARAGL